MQLLGITIPNPITTVGRTKPSSGRKYRSFIFGLSSDPLLSDRREATMPSTRSRSLLTGSVLRPDSQPGRRAPEKRHSEIAPEAQPVVSIEPELAMVGSPADGVVDPTCLRS